MHLMYYIHSPGGHYQLFDSNVYEIGGREQETINALYPPLGQVARFAQSRITQDAQARL
jgi:hypothetical protein